MQMNQKIGATRKIIVISITICIIAAVSGAFALSVLTSKDSTISNLNSQVNSLNSQNSNLNNTILLDNSTMDDLNSEITNLNDQISFLQATNSSLSTQNLALQNQISNLTSQLALLNSLNSSLTSQNNQLEEQVNNLTSQLNTLNLQYDELNSTYNTLNNQYAELQDELTGILGINNGTFLAYSNEVAVTNYTYTEGLQGMTVWYTGTIDLYNFGSSSCNVTVEVYGGNGDTQTFTLSMPVGYQQFVETWNSGLDEYYYPNITILSVER